MRWTQRVVDILGFEEPLTVPDRVIAELQCRGNSDGIVSMETEERKRFVNGERVRVSDGPFKSFMALIEVDAGHEVKAWLETLRGDRVLTTFGPESLEAV